MAAKKERVLLEVGDELVTEKGMRDGRGDELDAAGVDGSRPSCRGSGARTVELVISGADRTARNGHVE